VHEVGGPMDYFNMIKLDELNIANDYDLDKWLAVGQGLAVIKRVPFKIEIRWKKQER
jgi:hypothetical protein